MPIPLIPGAPAFQSGVGGGRDLKLKIREDLEGGWFALLHAGTFYLEEEERYFFARKGYLLFSEATVNEVRTATVTGLAEDPTTRGPIRLLRQSDGKALQRVGSPLAAFVHIAPADWTDLGDDVKWVTVPGLLVQLCTNPRDGVYLQVPAVADIISTEDYVYDAAAGKIYLKDATPPHLYMTYVRGGDQAAPLTQEEILCVDPDGKLRTQLSGLYASAGFEPKAFKPTDTGILEIALTLESKNVLTHAEPDLLPGDLVAVKYWAKDTFHAHYDSGTLTVTYFPTLADDYFIEYELGLEHYDTSQLPTADASRLQLNPLLAARESGFVYLTDIDAERADVAKVRLQVDDANPLFVAAGSAPVLVTLTALDSEGDPIPGVELTLIHSGIVTQLEAIGTDTLADGRGQRLFRITPLAAGNLVLQGKAGPNGGPYTAESDTLTLTVRAVTGYTDPVELQLGKLLTHLEESPYRDRLQRFSAFHCYPDGVPYQPDGVTQAVGSSIKFTSQRSTLHTLDLAETGTALTVLTDGDGIATVLVEPVPGDTLRAEVDLILADGTRRTRRARPLRIPSEPANEAPEAGLELNS